MAFTITSIIFQGPNLLEIGLGAMEGQIRGGYFLDSILDPSVVWTPCRDRARKLYLHLSQTSPWGGLTKVQVEHRHSCCWTGGCCCPSPIQTRPFDRRSDGHRPTGRHIGDILLRSFSRKRNFLNIFTCPWDIDVQSWSLKGNTSLALEWVQQIIDGFN